MQRLISCCLIIALLPHFLLSGNGEGRKSISEAELRAHVEFLASAELEGRAAPGRGSEIAERYIITRFRQYGLEELGDAPGYRQSVPLVTCRVDYENSRMVVNGKKNISLKALDSFIFFPRQGMDMDIIAPLYLAGYGISAPEYSWDDYPETEARGKIVLVQEGEPTDTQGKSQFTGDKPSKYSRVAVKARIAQEKGAKALLIHSRSWGMGEEKASEMIPQVFKDQADKMSEPIVQLDEAVEFFPVLYLHPSCTGDIFGDGDSYNQYIAGIDEKFNSKISSLNDKVTLTLQLRFCDIQKRSTANIIGIIPGNTEEAVLLVAHHDHEGIIDGVLYPGADDNASGVAGLLGVASSLSSGEGEYRRPIMFLSTGAEEKGYLGARYFLQHPPYPIEDIVAVINLDMIGRNGSSQFRAMRDPSVELEEDLLMVFHSGQSPQLGEIAEEENKTTGFDLVLEPVLHFHSGSDHVPFHEAGIPSFFLFGGFHSDYTSPGDTPEKINYKKLVKVTQFACQLVSTLAQIEERPAFDRTIQEVESSGGKYGN